MRKTGLLLLVLGAMVFIFSGCILTGKKKTEWKPVEPVNSPPFIHTVKFPGETLRIISQWYTGDVNNWKALAEANPNIDLNNMAMNTRIYIPETLLKTTKQLTKEYIDSYNQKSTPSVKEKKMEPVSKTQPPPKKDEDFDLIGPK